MKKSVVAVLAAVLLTVLHTEGGTTVGTTYMIGGAEFVYDGVWEGEI